MTDGSAPEHPVERDRIGVGLDEDDLIVLADREGLPVDRDVLARLVDGDAVPRRRRWWRCRPRRVPPVGRLCACAGARRRDRTGPSRRGGRSRSSRKGRSCGTKGLRPGRRAGHGVEAGHGDVLVVGGRREPGFHSVAVRTVLVIWNQKRPGWSGAEVARCMAELARHSWPGERGRRARPAEPGADSRCARAWFEPGNQGLWA